MAAATLLGWFHRHRQRRGEPDMISEISDQSGADMVHDPGTTTSDLDTRPATITLHHGSALLVGILMPSNSSSFPHQKGVFADATQTTPTHY